MSTKRSLRASLALVPLALAALHGPVSAQVLNIGIGGSITSADPLFYNAGPNNALAMHVFDYLIGRDDKAQPYPQLAESWRAVEPTVWEFKLRAGV